MALTKEQILGLSDIQVKEIKVPVWDDTVYIRQLTRGQQDSFMFRKFGKSSSMRGLGKQSEIDSNVNLFGHDAWIAAMGICDDSGNRLFSNSEVKQLEERNGEAIGFIASEILKFSGMTKDIEELEEALDEERDDVKN